MQRNEKVTQEVDLTATKRTPLLLQWILNKKFWIGLRWLKHGFKTFWKILHHNDWIQNNFVKDPLNIKWNDLSNSCYDILLVSKIQIEE